MSSERTVISVKNVSKDFKLPHQKVGSIKSGFTGLFSFKKKGYEVQHALRNIDFDVKRGEFFGIVGRNGSGKSTLLKILAGIYQPTKGSVRVEGRIVPFIELGVGFNGDLSGRDNVYLNGAMLGFSEKEIDEKYQDIVDFAELERFMDQKLKNYSSGMQVRLAFSVATRLAESDVLLIDEVLAVGDADFQRKCFNYFQDLKKQKKTVIFVSHDMNAVREYCDRAVLIDSSELVTLGSTDKVATQYTRMFMNSNKSANHDDAEELRWGEGPLRYKKVTVEPTAVEDGVSDVIVRATYSSSELIEKPILGFSIKNAAGTTLLGTNTFIKRQTVSVVKPGKEYGVEWKVQNIFEDGDYMVSVAATYPDGTTTCDWWDEVVSFKVFREARTPYIVSPEVSVKITEK